MESGQNWTAEKISENVLIPCYRTLPRPGSEKLTTLDSTAICDIGSLSKDDDGVYLDVARNIMNSIYCNDFAIIFNRFACNWCATFPD